MNSHPKIIGSEVPTARTRRKSEVFPGKTECAIVENKKADNPNPDNTSAVKLVLYVQQLWNRHRCVDDRVGFGHLQRALGSFLRQY